MLKLRFYNFEILSSTNDKAIEFAKQGNYNIVVTAKNQFNGRGRFGREWDSELGGLYMTLLLEEKDIDKSKYITLIASISVAKAIRECSGLDAKLKWPNDVLINERKICGILTETVYSKISYALVGIGLNVNNRTFPNLIKNKATSLRIETGKDFDIGNLSEKITKHFSSLYASYYKPGNYEKIRTLWKKCSHTLGKKIRATTLNDTFVGKAVDIDGDCNLILKLDDGSLKKIVEADIFAV